MLAAAACMQVRLQVRPPCLILNTSAPSLGTTLQTSAPNFSTGQQGHGGVFVDDDVRQSGICKKNTQPQRSGQ